MNRNIFTRRHQAARAAILNTIGALALVAGCVAMLLAFFDVLVK